MWLRNRYGMSVRYGMVVSEMVYVIVFCDVCVFMIVWYVVMILSMWMVRIRVLRCS